MLISSFVVCLQIVLYGTDCFRNSWHMTPAGDCQQLKHWLTVTSTMQNCSHQHCHLQKSCEFKYFFLQMLKRRLNKQKPAARRVLTWIQFLSHSCRMSFILASHVEVTLQVWLVMTVTSEGCKETLIIFVHSVVYLTTLHVFLIYWLTYLFLGSLMSTDLQQLASHITAIKYEVYF
jgi:hypothetical protein